MIFFCLFYLVKVTAQLCQIGMVVALVVSSMAVAHPPVST